MSLKLKTTTILVVHCCFLSMAQTAARDAEVFNSTNKLEDAEGDDVAEEFLEIMENLNLGFGPEKDRVLLLGETGSGKSFISCLLANDETLQAKRDGWKLTIADQKGRVSTGPVTESKTIVPARVLDEERHAYFDCPGYDDTRGVAKDVFVSYILKKLLTHTTRLKLAFVIDYNNIASFGTRGGLLNLAIHATSMFKNLEYHAKSAMLIVNKTPNIKVNGSSLSDQQLVEFIVEELETIRKTKEEQNKISNDIEIIESNLKLNKFIGSVTKNNGSRIGIVHLVEQDGPINRMSSFIESRSRLRQIINGRLEFFDSDGEKIKHTISHESKQQLWSLSRNIKRHLQEALDEVTQHIRKVTIPNLENQTGDIGQLLKTLRDFYDSARKVNEISYRTSTMTPNRFLGKLRFALKQFEIIAKPKIISHPVMSEQVFDIIREVMVDIDFGEFFENISGYWIEKIDFLRMTAGWYEFLNFLDKALIPRTEDIDIDNLIDECNGIKEGETLVIQESLKHLQSFLSSIDQEGLYATISDFSITFNQVQMFKRILESHRFSRLKPDCDQSTLTIKGSKVPLSSVIKHECWEKAVYIDIFASTMFIVDTTAVKRTENGLLSIFAPHLEVTAKHIIYLNGTNGRNPEPRKADVGSPGIDGQDGKAGCHLSCIVGSIHNVESLSVDVTGGIGGDGQAGGDGTNGTDGEDPITFHDEKKFEQLWIDNKYNYRKLTSRDKKIENATRHIDIFEVNGKDGTPGRNGKDGGKPGRHYDDGDVIIVFTNTSSSAKINIIHRKKFSKAGVKGLGGRGGRNGKQLIVEVEKIFENGEVGQSGGIEDVHDRSCQKNGTDGHQYEDNPDRDIIYNPEIMHLYRALNKFKTFLRSEWKTYHRPQKLANFLESINFNSVINKDITLIDLVNDFISMEGQFSIKSKESSNDALLQSFILRLKLYSSTTYMTSDQSKVFRMLHAAVLSKINALKEINPTTADLKSLLNSILNKIEESDLSKQSQIVQKDFEIYLNIMKETSTKGGIILSERIDPKWHDMFDNLQEQMLDLVNLIIEEGMKEDQNLEKSKELEEKLIDNISRQKMQLSLEVALGTVRLFNGVCDAIFRAWSGSDDELQKQVTSSIAFYRDVNQKYSDLLGFLSSKLVYTLQVLAPFDAVSSLKLVKDQFSLLGTMQHSQLQQFEEDCSSIMRQVADQEEEKKFQTDKKLIRLLRKHANLIEFGVIGAKKYIEIVRNATIMDELHEVVSNSLNFLNTVRDQEDLIYDKLIPNLKKTIEVLQKIYTKVWVDKTQMIIDFREWPLKKTFKDLQMIFRDISDGTDNQKIASVFGSLKEIMDLNLDFYNRFEVGNERYLFSSSLTDVVSQPGYDNIETIGPLQDSLDLIKDTIFKNLILDRHQMAVRALKQYKFPFARLILSSFELNNTLQSNEIKDIAKAQVELMQNWLDREDTAISVETQELVEDAKGSPPSEFFYWNHTNCNTIDFVPKLFRGDEISLYADITKTSTKNAVKFKELELYFPIPGNRTREEELISTLENFRISMSMGVNNFYRCNDDIYSIPNYHNSVIGYNIKRGPKGEQEGLSEDYLKIVDGLNFVLSPYTSWKIRLNVLPEHIDMANAYWEKLRSFEKDGIDIVLQGREQYFRRESTISKRYCTRDLKNYYQHADYM